MKRFTPVVRFLVLVMVLALNTLVSTSSEPAAASGSIKLWSGIHLGNRPAADWNSTLLAKIDGDKIGGTWPESVVFLSSQLYNLSRDGNCRIKTGANDTTTGRPVLLDYLQRASQNGVRIIIRIHPSPGNFDANHNLWVGPIPGIGYCDWNNYRPADDISDEMIAIHNYNQAHGITEWGFEPANEPNNEWYVNTPVGPWQSKAWQHMNTYFKEVWFLVPWDVRALTPPMAQGLYAEMNNVNDIDRPDPCPPMRLDNDSTGYDMMRDVYGGYSDGITWHNYWRLGWENSGSCQVHAQHVSYFFPQWMQSRLTLDPGTITEADLFSYGSPPHQDANQPLHDKDDVEGWPAANSLRKFFYQETRAEALVAWLLNDNVNDPNQDHNWHEAYNDQSGDSRRAWFTEWWDKFERWAPPEFLPDVRRDSNGWNSTLVVRNNSSVTAKLYVDFYDQGGVRKASGLYFPPGNGIAELIPPVPSDFSGSGIVYAERDVAVVAENLKSGEATNYNGITLPNDDGNAGWGRAGTTIYVPSVKYQLNGRTGRLYIFNAGPDTANVSIVLRKWNNEVGSYSCGGLTINPHGSSVFVPSNDPDVCPGLEAGQLYGAMLTSTQPLAVILVEQSDSGAALAASNNAFSAGAQTNYAPLAKSNFPDTNPNSSAIVVQNVGSGSTWVEVTYYDRDSGDTWSSTPSNIDPLSTRSFWVPSTVPTNKVTSARIVSTWGPLVVTSGYETKVSGTWRMQYNGFLEGSTTIVLPRIYRNFNDGSAVWTTGVQVQNLGNPTSNITIEYYQDNGFHNPDWVETPRDNQGNPKTIARYHSWTFWQGAANSPLPASNFVGSAVITSDQPIVAQVNVVRDGGGDPAMSYSGINR